MPKINVSEGDPAMSIEKSSYRIGYARVSTLEQDEALQHDALTAAGCERVFVDRVSGKLEHRPALDAMLEQLCPGDSVTVWRLDRLGRSLRHLIDVVADLERRDVTFRSLTEALDTSTPGGKLTFHLFGALAEFEHALIRERTMAGLAAARARGRKGGRPTVWTPDKLQTARKMYDSRDYDVAAIGRVIGVSRASVYRALADRDASTVSPDGLRPPTQGQPTGPLRLLT
jgi:DNA invertase Pin-like site-specific DNA recombinase